MNIGELPCQNCTIVRCVGKILTVTLHGALMCFLALLLFRFSFRHAKSAMTKAVYLLQTALHQSLQLASQILEKSTRA